MVKGRHDVGTDLIARRSANLFLVASRFRSEHAGLYNLQRRLGECCRVGDLDRYIDIYLDSAPVLSHATQRRHPVREHETT